MINRKYSTVSLNYHHTYSWFVCSLFVYKEQTYYKGVSLKKLYVVTTRFFTSTEFAKETRHIRLKITHRPLVTLLVAAITALDRGVI